MGSNGGPPTDASGIIDSLDLGSKSKVDLNPDHNVNPDPFHVLGAGLNTSVGTIKQNYFNVGLMTRGDLSDDQELELLRNSEKQNYGSLDPEELKASPWYVRAGVDAEGLGASLINTFGSGVVTGGAFAGAAVPASAVLSETGLGVPAAAVVESGAYSAGFTTGSLASIGTQAAGSMYGMLRQKGVSRDTSKVIAGGFGAFSTALGAVGFGATQKLGGAAASVGLRNSLVPLAEQAGFSTANAAARKVQTTLLTRLGLAYAEHVGVNTAAGEGNILLKHGALAAAGYLEKHSFNQYTNWDDAKTDMQSNFLQLLGANALIGLGVGAGGMAAGTAKTTTEQLLTPETVARLESELKNTSPQEILQRVDQALYEKPFPHEENPNGQVVHTEDGRTILVAGVSENGGKETELDATQGGPSNDQIAAAEGDAQPASENPLAGTPLGDAAQAVADATGTHPADVVDAGATVAAHADPETQAALDALMAPHEDQFAPADTQGREMAATVDPQTALTPEETQARINQIAADSRLLTLEQRRLEAQFNRKEKMGHSTNATLTKLESTLNTKEELQLERDMLEQGLMNREDLTGAHGKQRIKALGDIMDRLQKSNDRNIALKQKYDNKVQLARQTGMNVERRSIQTMQKQLSQYINTATKDRAIRTQLAKIVNGVTTAEQFKTAGAKIHTRLVELEKQKIADAEKNAHDQLVGEIEKLIKQGSKVKMQSGHPVSGLDADTIKAMTTLKTYLKDQNQPKAKRQNLTGQAITDFNNAVDGNGTTYADLMATGQGHLIPLDEMQNYRLAVLAHDLKSRTPMELNIIKGNIAQMIDDAKNDVAQKRAVLAQQRADELQIAAASTGADTHTRIEGNAKPGRKVVQSTETLGSNVLTFDSLMDYISPKDRDHAIRGLTDVTPAKHEYRVNQAVVKGGLRQYLQEGLDLFGKGKDIQKYMREASDDEYEFRYVGTDGKQRTARYNRAQMIDIHMKMLDFDLHDTMRDHVKGNGWTLYGDAPHGESFQELVEGVLKPEDFTVAHRLMDFYQDYHGRVNQPYREKYGVDLPMRINYSPLSREGFKVEPGQGSRGLMFASLLPGAAKSRTNNLNRIVPRNAFEVADDHVDGWEYFRAYDGVLGTLKNVFSNRDIRQRIKDEHGTGTMAVIDSYIDRFVENDPMPSDRGKMGWVWAAARGSMARATLPFRAPFQILQQLSAGTAMWKDHSLGDIFHGAVTMAKNIPATEKAFRNSPVLQHRYDGGASFDLHTAMHQAGLLETIVSKATGIGASVTPEQHQYLMRLGFEGIRLGDAAAVRMFGGPVYWAEINKGRTPEQAIMAVERLAESTQQGDSVDQIPDIYANNAALYSLLGQFHLQPLQMFSHSMVAFRDWLNKPTPANSMVAGKQAMILWILPGLFYGMIQSAPSLFAPPTDNPDVRNQALTTIAGEGILGPVNGVPLMGDLIEAGFFSAMKPLIGVDMNYRARVSGNNIADRYDNFMEMIQAWTKVFSADDTTKLPTLASLNKDPADDLFKAVFKTARSVGPLTGIPTQYVNAPAGIANGLRHDDWIGAMFALGGWSPGTIQPRYKAEDSFSLPSVLAPEKQSFVDWGAEFAKGAIGAQQDKPEDSQQYLNNFTDGALNGTIDDTDLSSP